MNERVLTFATRHSQTIILVAVVLAFLLVGAVGEAAAHNPAGQPVPGGENGADAVHNNPNCHG
jgi:hypothetical protein